MALVGDIEVVLTIRFSTPPGTQPQDAGKMIAANGIQIPLGLVQFVRHVNVDVVPVTGGPSLVAQ